MKNIIPYTSSWKKWVTRHAIMQQMPYHLRQKCDAAYCNPTNDCIVLCRRSIWKFRGIFVRVSKHSASFWKLPSYLGAMPTYYAAIQSAIRQHLFTCISLAYTTLRWSASFWQTSTSVQTLAKKPFRIKLPTFGTISLYQLDILHFACNLQTPSQNLPWFIDHHYLSSDCRRLGYSSLTLSALQISI